MRGVVDQLSRSANLLNSPTLHSLADVHAFSLLEGDVRLGAGSKVLPGTVVTAAPGASVVVNKGCSLLSGVLVEAISGGQVVGTDGVQCSIWLGDRATIAHKAILHSPAFIGKNCFIGLRSTVFNARLGDGCVVMMHALVQDVEVPPGRCVPSGSVIVSQHQADQLPNVRPEDLALTQEVAGITTSTNSSTTSSINRSSAGPSRQPEGRLVSVQAASGSANSVSRSANRLTQNSPPSHSSQNSLDNSSYAREGAHMQSSRQQDKRLAPEIVQQVRQYLAQGYRVGMEHADVRRYRSGVWETCTPIKETRDQAVFEALERCLAEHEGEYVRMFGIDTQVKQRVGMVTVQRPDGRPGATNKLKSGAATPQNGSAYAANVHAANRNGGGSSNSGGLSPEAVQEVRNLLRGGYAIGTEHADVRRYRSNVWKSCSPIQSNNEQEVLSRLDHCLAEHSGEYVRMFGINTQAKQRLGSVTIQRADGKPAAVSPSRAPANTAPASSGSYGSGSYGSGSYGSSSYGNTQAVGGIAAQTVNQILAQGNQVGVEYADVRRYRSGIWQTAPSVQSINQLQGFLTQNADKYVRIFGVNKSLKTRGSATTIQKPGQTVDAPSGAQSAPDRRDPINANPPHYDDPAFLQSGKGNGGAVDSEVMDQVTQLVNQGCRIAIEFADKRRFRSGIWQTGPAIDARRPAEAISALGKQLAQHQGDYVRLVGVDPTAKRRVLEKTIQRP